MWLRQVPLLVGSSRALGVCLVEAAEHIQFACAQVVQVESMVNVVDWRVCTIIGWQVEVSMSRFNLVPLVFVFSTVSLLPSVVLAERITLNDTGVVICLDHQGNWSGECLKSRQDAAEGRDVYDTNPGDGAAGFSFRKVCRSGAMAGEGECPIDPQLGGGSNDWGCTFDSVSQLTWEVKTSDGGAHDFRRGFSNRGNRAKDDPSDAAWLVANTNSEGLCGATNWRLPDVMELYSILNFGRADPKLEPGTLVDPNYFPNFTRFPFQWTRTELHDDNKFA